MSHPLTGSTKDSDETMKICLEEKKFAGSAISDILRVQFLFGCQIVFVLQDDCSLKRTKYIISLLTDFLYDTLLVFPHSFVFFVKIIVRCFLIKTC